MVLWFMKRVVAVVLLVGVFAGVVEELVAGGMTNVVELESGDSPAVILEKAAHIGPTPRQLAYSRREYLCFVHWGPNAFSRREWGTGKEPGELFAPPKADTDQWCRTIKAAGMRQVVLTVKHHDGYCLWQSRYTRHGVMGSPWKGGKGDVLRSLSESCRKYGLKLGVYLSPADLYQMESQEGLYGNLSKYSWRTIPRKVAGRPFKDKRTFQYYVDDYNEYFLNQLFELLTEYGPIHEVWFDGAHPKHKGGQKYTYANWYELIRTLAPEAVIFGKGPDVRWCGNEAGRTRVSEWNVIPLQMSPDKCDWPDLRAADLGSLAKLQKAKYLYWLPAEVDTSIRAGWFYRDERQRVRPAAEVFDIYERSIGGNTTLILNVPPNREGLFSDRDVKSLTGAGRMIRNTYGKDLLDGASSVEAGILDDDPATGWSANKDGVVIKLAGKCRLNRFMLQEDVERHGQRVAKHALDAWVDGDWEEIATGTTVGYKKILRFAGVDTDQLRLRVVESRLTAVINRVGAYYAAVDDAEAGEEDLDLLSRRGWKVLGVSSVQAERWGADKAIDGKRDTFWHTSWVKGAPSHPHYIAIDLGAERSIGGFAYLPRQDKKVPDSMIEEWRFEVSDDGTSWREAAHGSFGNILNDPSRRVEYFAKAQKCRYVKLVSLSGASGKPYAGAAELQILKARVISTK
jgi:alpha-L-fucosidase